MENGSEIDVSEALILDGILFIVNKSMLYIYTHTQVDLPMKKDLGPTCFN